METAVLTAIAALLGAIALARQQRSNQVQPERVRHDDDRDSERRQQRDETNS
jgi:hypothetical protein